MKGGGVKGGVSHPQVAKFGSSEKGLNSARGVAAIVVCCRNSSCNSSCDAIARNGRRTIALFLCCFEFNSLFAIGCVIH